VIADGERGVELAVLGVLGEAAGIALDDGGVGGQGEAEGARGQGLGLGGVAPLGGEVVERSGRGVAQAGERHGRRDGRGDPCQRDDVAQPNDDRRVRASREPLPWA
jgi:hypothetical protein